MTIFTNKLNNKLFDFSVENRKTHVHVVGGSGKGKSTLFLQWIIDDINNDRGVCVIDPHGSLIDSLLSELETADKKLFSNHYSGKQYPITLIEPTQNEWVLPLNPLYGHKDPVVGVQRVVSSILAAWGQFDETQTPRLPRILTILLEVLVRNDLALSDALLVISQKEIREKLLLNMPADLQNEWKFLNTLKETDYIAFVESVLNRIFPFNRSLSARRLFGLNTEDPQIFKKMQAGQIVLVNLAPSDFLHESTGKLIGSLIINDIIAQAKRIKPHLAKPSFVYIDECYNYVNNDIASALEETRKFGLHFVLAHQNLGQLEDKGERVKQSILAIQNKVVFGGCAIEDAKYLTEVLFSNSIKYNEYKPDTGEVAVVDYRMERMKSESFTEGESYGNNKGISRATSRVIGVNQGTNATLSRPADDFDFNVKTPRLPDETGGRIPNNKRLSIMPNTETTYGQGITYSENQSLSEQENESESESFGTSTSYSVSYAPMLIPILGETRGQLYSLQEQIQRYAGQLTSLGVGECILRSGGDEPAYLKVSSLPKREGYDIAERAKRQKKLIYAHLSRKKKVFKAEIIDEKIEKRHTQLKEKIKKMSRQVIVEPESFIV